ncbi:hypothetical protein NQ317_002203 [Molorchus minor]|uniref:CHK kinase-like domain-containing protein n=1 Tax=Molorchus minor TaxID=1323400 RepID=A0ABQ9JN47_9CUCU|nr:hypothetical protein NQ317_002203 [Molorchus minor]
MSLDIKNLLCNEDCEKILFKYNEGRKMLDYNIKKYIALIKENESCVDHNNIFFLKCLPLFNENQKNYEFVIGVFKNSKLSRLLLSIIFLRTISALLLRMFRKKNYQVSSSEYFNFGQIKGALSTLARFHAASIIYEEKRSTNQSPFRISEHFAKEIAERTFSFRGRSCEKYVVSDEMANKIVKYINSEDGLKKLLRPSEKYRNVLCHDDLWRNNIMFNETDDCLLVDFQLCRYTPPIFDVLLMLYINVEKNILRANFPLFLDMYYDFLKTELSYSSINNETVIPKSSFLQSAQDYSLPALIESGLYGTNTFLPEELSTSVISNMDTFEEFSFKNRSPFILKEYENNENYRKRFNNVLEPLFEILEKI